MFDTLSDKLQVALGDLRGRGVLRKEDLSRAMRKIRWRCSIPTSTSRSSRSSSPRSKDRAIGAEMTKSLTPGQEAVDRVAASEHSPSSMSTKAGKAIPKQTIGI
jgi:signal recognition particle subunit SRP54